MGRVKHEEFFPGVQSERRRRTVPERRFCMRSMGTSEQRGGALAGVRSNTERRSGRDFFVRGVGMFPVYVIAALSLLMPSSHAGQAGELRAPAIEVTGHARVEVPADLAVIELGVVTRAPTAGAAARQNSELMDGTLSALRKALGAAGRITTGAYTLRPEHVFPREGGAPKVTGYVATNIVRIETGEMQRLGELIDLAVKTGANQVQRMTFTLRDQAPAQRQALGRAVREARDKAEAIASALGLKLGAIHTVTEQEVPEVRPLMREALVARADAGPVTPVEPGLVEVATRVSLRVLLAP
jgi:uncharacterized protein